MPTPVCYGDCDHDGAVTIAELIRLVNIALGRAPIGDCLAGDRNANGAISVDELVVAVSRALHGCGDG
jgi:Ca2+-binding EF-hand superfamily protein